jgi:hypothetical protein
VPRAGTKFAVVDECHWEAGFRGQGEHRRDESMLTPLNRSNVSYERWSTCAASTSLWSYDRVQPLPFLLVQSAPIVE